MRTKSDTLTIKQQVFVQKVIELLSPTKAARIAYPDCKDPKDIAKKNMRKPKIREALDGLMQDSGITQQVAIKRAREIIMQPKESDAVSVAGLNLVGKWSGWEAPRGKVEMPSVPKTPGEIDEMLNKMRGDTWRAS
ncbi:terminase small subunit [Candidatus Woesebacteria bacterium]|nr:MAG: terminase small subunit [Candidatus Woesebacteria bacterium]